MSKRDLRELLSAYHDGELEADDRAEVEALLESDADLRDDLAQMSVLDELLRDGIAYPAERAEESGQLAGMWDDIERALALQPLPAPAPSVWRRIADGWTRLFEPRQAWVPALAAAAVLAIMIGLLATRATNPPTGASGDAPAEVAHAPVQELPPFAGPRLEHRYAASNRATRDEAKEGQHARSETAQDDARRPAPRRRGREEMVARANEAFVVDYEVNRGIVLIEQNPDDPAQPMVVWHLMPEDERNGGSI